MGRENGTSLISVIINYTRESYPCHIRYYNEVYESLGSALRIPVLKIFSRVFVDSDRSMRGRKNLRLRELSIRKVHSTFYTRTTREKYIYDKRGKSYYQRRDIV